MSNKAYEAGGVFAGGGKEPDWVTTQEHLNLIRISIGFNNALLNPDQARALARQLYRHARRVETKT